MLGAPMRGSKIGYALAPHTSGHGYHAGQMAMQISTEAVNAFLSLVRVQEDRFSKQIHDEVQNLERQASINQALANSRTALVIQERCINLLSVRLQAIWGDLVRATSAHGIELTTDRITAFFEAFAGPARDAASITRQIFGNSAVFRSGLNDLRPRCLGNIDQFLAAEIQRIKAEAVVVAAKNSRPDTTRAPTISVQGHGNVIVAGDGNWVHTATRFEGQSAQSLCEVLQFVLGQLERAPPIEAFDVDELKQIVQESIREAQQTKPNTLKLKGVLRTITDAVKLVPAMKEAYDTIVDFSSRFDWRLLVPSS